MWWHRLIRYWTKSDYAVFTLLNWVLVFSLLILVRLIQGRSLDLVFAIAFSSAFIPVSLFITAIFQKYSSEIEDIAVYPALLPSDLEEGKLLRNDKALAFVYTEWCPYCWKSFHLLKFLNDKAQSEVFRIDLSDENNPLWDSPKIKTVPTLIAFKDGIEFWRADGILMIGLREKDFEKAAMITS